MKIVILTNIPSPYRVDFFRYLQSEYSEHEFHIIYSAAGLSDRSWSVSNDKLINSHFLITKTITIKGKMDAKHIHITMNTKKILSSLHPDIIICSEYNPTILQAIAWAKHHHVPYISWTDGTLFSERNIIFLQKLSRKYVIKGARAFIASSSRSKEAQIAYGADIKAVFVSSLTVDIHKYLFTRNSYQNQKLLYVGSLSERKGLDLLFHALPYVKGNYHLTLIGDGDKKSELISLAETLQLTDRITFAGYLEGSSLEEVYHTHDIFVLPTREDCFGLVILEAMCASMPVISSCYADGAYDLIQDQVSGLIVNPYQPEAFARTIDILLADATKVEYMGTNAYQKALNYDFGTVSKGFLDAISYISDNIS